MQYEKRFDASAKYSLNKTKQQIIRIFKHDDEK